MKAKEGIVTIDEPAVQGVVGFIRGRTFFSDLFSFLSDQDGAVFLYSAENVPLKDSKKLVLVTLSEVKNKGSGWKDGKFEWGSEPPLLKKMNIEIRLDLGRKSRIYMLDGSGKRGRKVKTVFKDGKIVFSTENYDSCWFEIEVR